MNGLILLDKPEGVTSFGAVAAIRRIFGEKKAGHTGTLDPMATGVLPVLLGSATRLSDYLLSADKSYVATMRLGVVTDTLDRTGTVLSKREVQVGEEDFLNAMSRFRGEILQVPPMYSAIKQNGQPLYKLARQGVETERAARPVHIYEFTLLAHEAPDEYTVSVRCSKGTYIRTLCADLGEALGCGAILTALRRTSTGGFSITDCVTLEGLQERPQDFLLPLVRAVEHLPAVSVSEKQAIRFQNGGVLDLNRLQGLLPIPEIPVRVMQGDRLIGIGAVDREANALRIRCVLHRGE
ncbi:MAG: tRNA pseudouridine(55) synthase TruB [Clostridia bacterium]|nr:tRNA pseudouridine(55) synthase TruB [Clostridia bacterium]